MTAANQQARNPFVVTALKTLPTATEFIHGRCAMGLTLGHHLYAALHQDALNKLIRAYRAARPKYFFYAVRRSGQAREA